MIFKVAGKSIGQLKNEKKLAYEISGTFNSNEYYLFIILNFHITPMLDAPANPKLNFTQEFQDIGCQSIAGHISLFCS